MFNKLLWFTDIHFGRSGNSPIANQDNIDFISWAIERGKSWGVDTVIFGGDWHDCRHSLGVSTINYSLHGLDLLNENFKNVYYIPGNHDLFYRDKRDVASIEFAKYLENIKIIRDPTTIDNVTILPWLIGDEIKILKSLKSKYVFSHLELSGFMMNANVELPDAPHLANIDDLKNTGEVYSGHFHKRQSNGRVTYTGNAMPFSFSDANDTERGIMLLQYNHDPIFEQWDQQPLFYTGNFSDILANPSILKPKMIVKSYADIVLTQEEIQELKESLSKTYGLRKMEIIPLKADDVTENDFNKNVEFKSVDQMILEGFKEVKSSNIKLDKLTKIYTDIMGVIK